MSQELRCPKCQNQNIADSNAPIARDLRVVLYEQLEAGASDDEILAFMVARYGEFVRYRPAWIPTPPCCGSRPRYCYCCGRTWSGVAFKGRRVSSPAPLTAGAEKLERLMRKRAGRLTPDADFPLLSALIALAVAMVSFCLAFGIAAAAWKPMPIG